jgi:hypothetical protein
MKENGAMKEDRAAKLLLLQALSEMCGRCAPGTAIILIYNILLGRDPDPDGEAFYGARLDGPPEQRLGALRELATSDEAQRYGLFSLGAEIDADAVHLPEEPLGGLAVLGLMRRRMIETMQRLDNIESLARLTLLSVPEWCGSAYTDLERRITALEDALTTKRAHGR